MPAKASGLVGLLAVWLLAASAAEAADNCAPLRRINNIALRMSADGTRADVPVTINGAPKYLLLDTGAIASELWRSTAKELNLPIIDGRAKLLDLYGRASQGAAQVSSFTVGELEGRDMTFLLSTVDNPGGNGAQDGVFGPDLMGLYDVELDFAGATMNYFSTQHCDGQGLYWPAPARAAVSMGFGADHHIVIPIALDGRSVRAVIDTGAPRTLIKADAAARVFGLAAAGPDDTALPDIDGARQFTHGFDRLELAGVAILNPRITIFPNLAGKRGANNSFRMGAQTARADDQSAAAAPVVLGMDVLSKLRLYIAFKEKKLYVTPAADPAALQPGSPP